MGHQSYGALERPVLVNPRDIANGGGHNDREEGVVGREERAQVPRKEDPRLDKVEAPHHRAREEADEEERAASRPHRRVVVAVVQV